MIEKQNSSTQPTSPNELTINTDVLADNKLTANPQLSPNALLKSQSMHHLKSPIKITTTNTDQNVDTKESTSNKHLAAKITGPTSSYLKLPTPTSSSKNSPTSVYLKSNPSSFNFNIRRLNRKCLSRINLNMYQMNLSNENDNSSSNMNVDKQKLIDTMTYNNLRKKSYNNLSLLNASSSIFGASGTTCENMGATSSRLSNHKSNININNINNSNSSNKLSSFLCLKSSNLNLYKSSNSLNALDLELLDSVSVGSFDRQSLYSLTHSEYELGNFYVLENSPDLDFTSNINENNNVNSNNNQPISNYRSCLFLNTLNDSSSTVTSSFKDKNLTKNSKVVDWLQHNI